MSTKDRTSRNSTLANVGMVARREVKARFFTKSNLISLAIMTAVIVVGIFVLDYFAGREGDDAADFTVALDSGTAELEPQLVAAGLALDTTVDVEELSRDDAEPRLAEDLDAFLGGDPARPEMLVEEDADQQLLAVVTSAVQAHVLATQVSELGGDPQAFNEALATAGPQVASVQTDEDADQFGPQYLVAVLAISLLLFALIGSGSLIAMGVVEEKTSRVVEILLATIRPSELLAGKILGIGIVSLVQVVVLSAAAAVPAWVTGLLDGFQIDLGGTLLLVLLWFFLGFTVFSLLFGGFAALISRQEEIGAVTTPLMFLMFVPYYLAMFMVTSDPDGTVVRVLSQIPFFSPFMMPVRHVFGGVETWEMLLSIGIALVAIPVLVLIAGRVYRRGVLHTGGRMKLTDALRG
ncbi:ABC-2 type transport system permease protein [Georgenia satyanarayanai]|uniref:ABC-2 type transport system permease protein n=1 Tax=Georgenia satyanarayanai TaxID=860221 RepID=A0A2Y9A5H0_9MICO|nr:ABC transporter permease [Georgenia satyanarayanai]PYG00907.1 ABC-2 type transport system permease protein [Georgenia satyanarayanai]SSA39146.1 ABC-2 type transport system permease protein [Georgenia satyanarayanai]